MTTFLDKVENMLEQHRKYLSQSFIYNDTDKAHLDRILSWLKTDLLTSVAEHFGETKESE